MKKGTDPAWEHCDKVPGYPGGTQCKFCGSSWKSGGISRFKGHLAGGVKDVAMCLKQGKKIRDHYRAILDGAVTSKNKKKGKEERFRETMVGMTPSESDEDEDLREGLRQSLQSQSQRGASGSGFKSLKKNLTNSFKRNKAPEIIDVDTFRRPDTLQRSISQMGEKQQDRETHFRRLVAKWAMYAGIPFHAATNNPYYQPMFDACARAGVGVKGPTNYELMNPLLSDLKMELQRHIDFLQNKWSTYGVTIMCDGWTCPTRKSLMNFMVYCDGMTIFVRSIDVTADVKDHRLLMRHMKNVIDEVGRQYIVQIVTDNGPNYKKAGDLISQDPDYHLYWTGCSTHCIDLILKEVARRDFVRLIIEQARTVTRFIYNHSQALALMREMCGGDIVRPAITRFATNFLALQSLLQKKESLKRMCTSDAWNNLKGRRPTEEMLDVEAIILCQEFWADVKGLCRVMEPLVELLRLCDGDHRPTMGLLHRWIMMTIDKVERIPGNHQWLVRIIKRRWTKQLGHKLHQAAYYLNPAIQFGPESEAIREDRHLLAALREVIERLVPDIGDQSKCIAQLKIFREARGDFGRPLAISGRTTQLPADWWFNFGEEVPELRLLAIRVLSQTTSSSGCERNWSTFGMIHSPRRCTLRDDHLQDLVFVHYNLRLKSRHAQITSEEYDVDLTQLYPPDASDDEDDAFEWVRYVHQGPVMDEGGFPDQMLAQNMAENANDHPPPAPINPADNFEVDDYDDSLRDSRTPSHETPNFRAVDVVDDVADDDETQPPDDTEVDGPPGFGGYTRPFEGATEDQSCFQFTEDQVGSRGSQRGSNPTGSRYGTTTTGTTRGTTVSKGSTPTAGNTGSGSQRGDIRSAGSERGDDRHVSQRAQGMFRSSSQRENPAINPKRKDKAVAGRRHRSGNTDDSIKSVGNYNSLDLYHGSYQGSNHSSYNLPYTGLRGSDHGSNNNSLNHRSFVEDIFGYPQNEGRNQCGAYSEPNPSMVGSYGSYSTGRPQHVGISAPEPYIGDSSRAPTNLAESSSACYPVPMEIDGPWFSGFGDALPSILEVRHRYPLSGFLLWGTLTQETYDSYIERYLTHYSNQCNWDHFCNVVLMPHAEPSQQYDQGRSSSYF